MCEPAWQSDKPVYYFDPADQHLKTYKMYILKTNVLLVTLREWTCAVYRDPAGKVMNLCKPCANKPA